MSDTDNDSATLAGTLRIADDSDSDSDVDSHAYSAHPTRDFDAESLSSWGTAVPSTPASLSASSSCASSEKGYSVDRDDDERDREREYDGRDGRDGRDVRSWQERTVTFASGTARPPGSEVGAGTNSSLWTPWKGWKTRSAAKESVRSSIRDFVLSDEPLSRSSALQETQNLLSSLHDTCTQLQLSTSLASILQDRYIQNHSPLYWCIVKKRPVTASVKTSSSLNSSMASISILKSAKSDSSSSSGAKKSDSKADLGSGSGAKIAKSYSTPKLPSLITLPSAKAKAATATIDLFPIFLAHALPITSKTLIAELRAACREAGDNASFQRLRLDVPRFSHAHAYRRRSGSASRGDFDGDRDDASVYEHAYARPNLNLNADGGEDEREPREDEIKVVLRDHLEREAFAVEMRFPDFSERLRTRRIVGAEFVVRDRIWLFAFAHRYVPALAQDQSQFQTRADVRAWTAELSIRDKSPSTWFSGDLLVVPPSPSSSSSSPRGIPPPPRKMGSHPDEKAQPVRMGTDAEPLSSANGNSIWVKLDGSPAFASLQHADCPYLDEDGTLHIRLEGRLENEGGW